jgi:hypothetical protein
MQISPTISPTYFGSILFWPGLFMEEGLVILTLELWLWMWKSGGKYSLHKRLKGG